MEQFQYLNKMARDLEKQVKTMKNDLDTAFDNMAPAEKNLFQSFKTRIDKAVQKNSSENLETLKEELMEIIKNSRDAK